MSKPAISNDELVDAVKSICNKHGLSEYSDVCIYVFMRALTELDAKRQKYP
jgi:hypothetical protein